MWCGNFIERSPCVSAKWNCEQKNNESKYQGESEWIAESNCVWKRVRREHNWHSWNAWCLFFLRNVSLPLSHTLTLSPWARVCARSYVCVAVRPLCAVLSSPWSPSSLCGFFLFLSPSPLPSAARSLSPHPTYGTKQDPRKTLYGPTPITSALWGHTLYLPPTTKSNWPPLDITVASLKSFLLF